MFSEVIFGCAKKSHIMLFDNCINQKVKLQFEPKARFVVKLLRVYARMTWLDEAMKDGVSTDMSRGVANRL